MKKLLATLSAVVLMTATTSAFTANADYIPTVYFTPHAETDSDGTIVINRSQLENGLTINTDIYIDDESLTVWSIDLKFKTSAPYLSIENIVNPHDPLIEYAYAGKTENGELTKQSKVSIDCKTIDQYTYFTCDSGLTMSFAFLPYGEKSNDYALTNFDLNISPDTPAGEYEVYFITEPTAEIDDSHISKIGMKGQSIIIPIVHNLNIKILDDSHVLNLGDINNDGFIDANDATIVLSAYSASATGEENGLNDDEFFAGDVNSDGLIDATDASVILGYYSYLSTSEGELSLEDYINQ